MSASDVYCNLPGEGSFRLLELHKGTGTDGLSGTLHQPLTFQLESKWEALSYRWTDPVEYSSIDINGVHFQIGANLFAALCVLRQYYTSRWLWIDQICINQEDYEEKLRQINLMGDFYSRATSTLIWLGEGSPQSDLGMQLLPIFIKMVQYEDARASLQHSEPIKASFQEWVGDLGKSICSLFDRDWFGRVWTLQEVALGKNAVVHCGKFSVPFSLFEDFDHGQSNDVHGNWVQARKSISWEYKSLDPDNPDRSMLAHIHTVSMLKDVERSVTSVLNTLRGLDCTQHQDRVFSVLRFLDKSLIDTLIEIGDHSPNSVYGLVAKHQLENNDMNHLGTAGVAQHRLTYEGTICNDSRPHLVLPSWVPDWTYKTRVESYWTLNDDYLRKRGEILYKAGGHVSEGVTGPIISQDGQIVCINGIVFDEISECTAPLNLPQTPKDLSSTVQNWSLSSAIIQSHKNFIDSCAKLASQRESIYGASKIEQAYQYVLIGGLKPDTSQTQERSNFMIRASLEDATAMFESFAKFIHAQEEAAWMAERMQSGVPFTVDEIGRLSQSLAATQLAPDINALASQVQVRMAETCKARLFFVTKDRQFMGLAPDISRPGDKVCVVPGHCAPVVLRPKGDRYQLVGECYVHGVMSGELLGDVKQQPQSIILE